MTTTNLRDLNLRPRAIALLVALRNGPRTLGQLCDAVADDSIATTHRLLSTMKTDPSLVRELPRASDSKIWYVLDLDGIGWLQSNGLDASDDAKRQLYDVLDAERAVTS